MSEKPRQMRSIHRMESAPPLFLRWFNHGTLAYTGSLLETICRQAFEAGFRAAITCDPLDPIIAALNPNASPNPIHCVFSAGVSHHCALPIGHTTPHQMVQTVQTLSGVRQG